MKTKNQQLIDQINEKRGEQKQFIALFSITAIVALAGAIFFFCMKEWGAGFASLVGCSLCFNVATAQKECRDYCEMLIDALTLIDMLGERAGIDPDEDEPKNEE